LTPNFYSIIGREILRIYDKEQNVNKKDQQDIVAKVISQEMNKFSETLDKGLRLFEKKQDINEKIAFDLYQSYGFPFEITQELARQKGLDLNKRLFEEELESHKSLSRTASAGKLLNTIQLHIFFTRRLEMYLEIPPGRKDLILLRRDFDLTLD